MVLWEKTTAKQLLNDYIVFSWLKGFVFGHAQTCPAYDELSMFKCSESPGALILSATIHFSKWPAPNLLEKVF